MNLLQRLSNKSNGYSIVLEPGQIEEAVHFMQGRGTIDLSDLSFFAFPREETGSQTNSTSYVDIAIFPLPKGCSGGEKCDLSDLGVGKRETFDGISFLDLCHEGRLRLDTGIYKGHHAYIKVPNTGKMAKSVEYSQLAAEHGQRDYEVMIANCNLSGRKIRIQGQVLFDFSKDQHPKTNTLTPFPGHPLVSISVFLFFTVCFVRIRFTTRAAYEELRSHSTARMGAVEMIETA